MTSLNLFLLAIFFQGTLAGNQPSLPIIKATVFTGAEQDTAFGDDGDWFGGCDIYEALFEPECKFLSRASSHLPEAGGNSYEPEKANDFDLTSAWVEGVSGHGAGEYIEYEFVLNRETIDQNLFFDELHIFNGYRKTRALWNANNRVKTLKMFVNGKPTCKIVLQDTQTCQVARISPIPIPIKGRLVLRFEILSVIRGNKYNDTAITELVPYGPWSH